MIRKARHNGALFYYRFSQLYFIAVRPETNSLWDILLTQSVNKYKQNKPSPTKIWKYTSCLDAKIWQLSGLKIKVEKALVGCHEGVFLFFIEFRDFFDFEKII